MIQITTRSDARGVETCAHAESNATATHATDALSRLCRLLTAAGLHGAAEVRGTDGRLRFTVKDIERLAQRTLREDDASGLRWHQYRPRPADLQEAVAWTRQRPAELAGHVTTG